MMKIPRTELNDLCKKIFEGQGFLSGDYEDCAYAIVWLEMHGWSVLDQLFQKDSDVPLTPSRPCHIISETATEVVLDATDNDGLVYGHLALDLAYLKATQQGCGQVILQQTRHQPLMIPSLLTCARRGMNALVHWRDEQGDHITTIEAYALYPLYTRHRHRPTSSDLLDGTIISIICASNDALNSVLRSKCTQDLMLEQISPAEFALTYAQHNQRGIAVDEAVWQRMVTLSKRVLVEATAESRQRGAGEAAE